MANKSGIKLLVFAAVVVAGYFGVSLYLRPVAMVQEVAGGKVAKAVSAQIKVRAETALEIKIESGGRMLNELKEGQLVAARDVLVEVDTEAKKDLIEGLEIDLKTLQATNAISEEGRANALKQARRDLGFKEVEKDAGRLPRLEYERLEDNVSALKLSHNSAAVREDDLVARKQLEIKTRKRELENLTFRAPWPGTLTDIKFSSGAYLSGGQTVATLITNTRVVEARISEENIDKGVGEGMQVRVRFTGIPDDFFGTISEILPNQDPQTLRYIAHLDLKIDPTLLKKTGQSGDGVITIEEKQAKVRVARRAIYNGDIYVVRDGKVEIRKPKLGFDSGGVVEILSGLEPGEIVIVDHQEIYRAGQAVRIESVLPPAK